MINGNSIEKFFGNKNFENMMFNLACRWADEARYENINDYAQPIINMIGQLAPEMIEMEPIKMTKRPFGFKVILPYTYKNGATRRSELTVVATLSGKYSWGVKLA